MIDSNEGKNFSLNSGVYDISLLSKTILVSIVTDGLNSHHPNTSVYLWDKYTKEVKKEFRHSAKVETTFLIPKKLFTLSQNTIFVWDLETTSIKELISTASDWSTFFVNSLNKSSITLIHQNDKKQISINNINANIETIIKPEVTEIQCMTMSDDQTYLAIVDTTGIYVYVYEIATTKLAFEFIRGKTSSKITWIQFSNNSKYLMLINDKGTLHMFDLDENKKINPQASEGLFSAVTQFVPKMLSKPTSFAKYHPNLEKLPEISWIDSLSGRIKGPFFHQQKEDTVNVFFTSGRYNVVKFDKSGGGECSEVVEMSGKSWFDPFDQDFNGESGEEDDDEYIII